jgi:nucleoside-diphosphate-sugar epimerase
MKILVTGSGTLLGKNIAKKLSTQHKIIASYNNSYPKELNRNKNIKIIKLNLLNNFNIGHSFDALIHCASALPVDKFSKKKLNLINSIGFKKILAHCKKNQCKKIIICSTVSVYGKIKKNYITEKTAFNFPDDYAITKIRMENDLKKYCKKNNADGLVLRMPGLLGYKSKNNFLSAALVYIKKFKHIKISNPYFKCNNMIHVDNLSSIIEHALRENKGFNIYNLGTKYPLKFFKIFEIMFRILKIKKKIIFNPKINKGFNIKLNNKFVKKYNIYTTKKTINKFVKENL